MKDLNDKGESGSSDLCPPLRLRSFAYAQDDSPRRFISIYPSLLSVYPLYAFSLASTGVAFPERTTQTAARRTDSGSLVFGIGKEK